jgi:cell division protein FtsB
MNPTRRIYRIVSLLVILALTYCQTSCQLIQDGYADYQEIGALARRW